MPTPLIIVVAPATSAKRCNERIQTDNRSKEVTKHARATKW
jgi:hypothetical protein